MVRWAALTALTLRSAGVSCALLLSSGQGGREGRVDHPAPLSCGLMGYLTFPHFVSDSTCSRLWTSRDCFHLKAHNRCGLADLQPLTPPPTPPLILMLLISNWHKGTDNCSEVASLRSLALHTHPYASHCSKRKSAVVCGCMSPHPSLCPLCPSAHWAFPHPSAGRSCVVAALWWLLGGNYALTAAKKAYRFCGMGIYWRLKLKLTCLKQLRPFSFHFFSTDYW